MDDKPINQETPFAQYRQIAHELVSAVVKSRSGFGAYRHYGALFAQTVQLAADAGLTLPGILEPVHWDYPPFHHWLRGLSRGSGLRFFFDTALGNPANFEPHALWALFWAVAKAEHDFLHRYVPFWSHEERLTGHLISQVVSRIEEYGTHWRALCNASDGEAYCRVAYADTATDRQEELTGADLGIVVHGRFAGSGEFFKVAVLQAKKTDLNDHIRFPVEQAERLLQRENLGYYIVYHPLGKTRWSLPPTVRPASFVKGTIEEAKKKHQATASYDTQQVGYDFAAFLAFGLADPAAEVGVPADTPRQAVHLVMAGTETPPTRVLIVTIGGGVAVVDWTARDLLGQWIRRANDNE